MEKGKVVMVERKKRRVPFESKIPRERNACPDCDSINVRKRNSTRDYMCYHCRWIGSAPKKIIW